jgi:hypothetical protein
VVELPTAAHELNAQKTITGRGQNLMILKSRVRKVFTALLILGASVIAGDAQTPASERAALPQRRSEKYWMVVHEFADGVVHFAYAKRFVEVHDGSLTDHQCRQFSRIAIDNEDQLAAVRRVGISTESKFWNDVRAYSISMIGAPGVPIPGRRTSRYWVTTGSEAEDRELRRMASLVIDEASSHLIRTGEYSPSTLKPNCRTALQELTDKDER